MPLVSEFSESIAPGVYIHDPEILPEKAQKFKKQQGIIEFVREGFDLDTEDLEHDREKS